MSQWKDVEALRDDGKFRSAWEAVQALRQQAQEQGDEAAWTRGLIIETQLAIGLDSFETAVTTLRQRDWPSAPRYRTVLQLFYARSLVNYLQSHSWQIRQRERIEVPQEDLDLSKLTAEQIAVEAMEAYAAIWPLRDEWGGDSLGELAEYIEQNTYPARIRGTLRDAVTYLWAELLTDTSLWSPQESNEEWRLDLGELLATGQDATLDLASSEVHPLRKLASILDDLEAWHRQGERPEAALEARLARLRILGQSFNDEADVEILRQDLESHLAALPSGLPWWSTGQHALAYIVQRQGDLVAAHELALEGARRHPKSHGGKACRGLVNAIEAATFALQGMAVDGPDRRSLLVRAKNLPTLHFRAYSLDLEKRLFDQQIGGRPPRHREVADLLADGEPSHRWQVELPPTPDYEIHQSYVTPPMTTPGLYVVVASTRADFSEELSSTQAVQFTLSDLVLATRTLGTGWETTVRSGRSGEALEGVEVTLYRRGPQRQVRPVVTQTSDARGRVRFAGPPEGESRAPRQIIAKHGDDRAFETNLYPAWRSETEPEDQALIYTDRSVYRPGQKVFWKIVAYRASEDQRRLQVAAGREVTVTLLDTEGEELATFEGTSNDFGSVAGEFVIPNGRLLGTWNLHSTPNAYASIRVEEYKRPTFEVELLDPEDALRLNQTAKLQGEARYYFGAPVTEGELSWRVIREPVYPPWWGWFRPTPGGRQTIAIGTADVDADGRFEIEFTPEAGAEAATDDPISGKRGGPSQVSYRYRIEVDLTNDGGETRSASRSFRLGHVAIEAQVEGGREFFLSERTIELAVVRRDLDGLPRSGQGRWQILGLDAPEAAALPAEQPSGPMDAASSETATYQTPGDTLRPRWSENQSWRQLVATWPDGDVVADGELEHGDDGRAALESKTLGAGIYRLRYTTEDSFGTPYATTYDFIVAAEGAKNLPLPLLVLADRSTAEVGETVTLLVHSGLTDQQLFYGLYLGDERTVGRHLKSGSGVQLIEIEIDETMRGNVGVLVELVRDHQALTQGALVRVPWSDRKLQLELATFRDTLRPGDEETWKVILRGAEGEALEEDAVELLATMYDRSLDIFGVHSSPHILGLFPQRSWPPEPKFTLGVASSIYRRMARGADSYGRGSIPSLQADRLKFYDEYNVGGPGSRLMMRFAAKAMPEAMSAMAGAPPAPSPPSDVQADLVMEETVVVESDESAEPTASDPVEATPEVRSNFAETAFWFPQLRLEADGAISFTFQVPDAVTEWNMWLHALTRDLRSVDEQHRVRTVKELLVRPYLPRFFRQLDAPELRVVIDNTGEVDFEGHLDLELFEVSSEDDLRAEFGLTAEQTQQVPFAVDAGGSTTLTFPVTVPQRLGEVALRVVGRAEGDVTYSDGELRPLPILPSRLHLAQSRFATLEGEERRELHFADMAADDDPSLEHEQLVVTLDGQLFYSVLHALPYLVKYPYNCTEQTTNRFLSTGIVSSLYDDYPAIATMAEQFAGRETPLEAWDEDDANRKMLMEETPWLRESRGGDVKALEAAGAELIDVLDPAIATATRVQALEELRQAQSSDGGFPWWSGGPPSPYITTYILMSLSRAVEFGVEVPHDMVQQAWRYLHEHFRRDMLTKMVKGECCVELATYLNFVLSSYPDLSWTGGVWTDDDRRAMLDASFKEWRRLSPLLKGYLALTLWREERTDDATLVWESVMDAAQQEDDRGVFWAPEERSWLWYNDTIEGHAFALRVLNEIAPEDPRRHGLVEWLLLNKKLGHWKSTRATAEVLYSLTHYLQQEGGIAQREEATVQIGDLGRRFVFEPDTYTGRKNTWRLDGPTIDPASMSTVVVEKETPGFLFASATWHFATDKLPEQASGDFMHVERQYFIRRQDAKGWRLEPLADGTSIEVGDQIEVQLAIRTGHAAEYVHLRDPRGAGFEPIDLTSGYAWDQGLGHYREIRDSGTNFFIEWLPAGEYTLKYRLRASLGGAFRVGPATLQSMYAPEFVAYSSGAKLKIE